MNTVSEITVAIDPSMHSSGIAMFENEVLVGTGLVKVPAKIHKYEACKLMVDRIVENVGNMKMTLVLEEQIHRENNEVMSRASFTFLASLTYMLAYALKPEKVIFYKPVQWKGTKPKHIHHRRIRDKEVRLKTRLILIVDNQSDIMDAVGIGRYYLENTKK